MLQSSLMVFMVKAPFATGLSGQELCELTLPKGDGRLRRTLNAELKSFEDDGDLSQSKLYLIDIATTNKLILKCAQLVYMFECLKICCCVALYMY